MVGALLLFAGYLIAFLNVPWIDEPVEEIEATFSLLT